jgi:gluconokinase
VVEQLTGQRAVDYSVASSSGYFNLHTHTWDDDLLGLLGLARERLSPPVDATEQAPLSAAAAERLGLKAGTPLVWGAGDGMLAHLATGGFDTSRFSSTIGTSGALRVLARRPLLDEQARTWCYCFDAQTWVAGGAINNGGLVLRWLRDQLGGEERRAARERGVDSYEVMCEVAATVPAGADGLVMLPFLTGERSPNWNAAAKGLLFGLQLHHTRAHLIRAGLEAVIFRMLSVYEALRSLTGQEGEIWANGGYTRSPLWVQIQADVFQRKVAVPRVTEASAFGASLVALKSVGLIGDYRDLEPAITVERSYQPDPAQAPAYQKTFALFQSLYDDVKHEFGRG